MILNLYGKLTQGTSGAAGYDLHACLKRPLLMESGRVYKIRTETYLALPEGVCGLICPRSGLATKGVTIVNAPGVIDSDYRGEICVLLANLTEELVRVDSGDRIAQILFTRHESITQTVQHNSPETLGKTERGTGGFGSTGTK